MIPIPAFLAGKGLKVLVAGVVIAAVAATAYFGMRYVKQLRIENGELRASVAIHERNATVYQSVIAKHEAAAARLAADSAANREALADAEQRNQAAWQTVRVLQRKFTEHDLAAIAKAHPDMLAVRIEAGTEALFREWQELANTP
jgi:hypothetical protein